MSLLDVVDIVESSLRRCAETLGCPIKLIVLLPLYVMEAPGGFDKNNMLIYVGVSPSPTETSIAFFHEVCHCLTLYRKYGGEKEKYDEEYEKNKKKYGMVLHPEEMACEIYGEQMTRRALEGVKLPIECINAFTAITIASLYIAREVEEADRILHKLARNPSEAYREAVEAAKKYFCRPSVCR